MGGRAVVVALVLTAFPAGLRAQTSDVALGIEALARRDIRAADAAFARASTGPNTLLRSSGYQWRGHLAWKVRGDTAAAVRYLRQALGTARDSSMVMLEIARLSGARRRYREAVRTAYVAMQRSGDAERRGLVTRTLVQLAVDGAFAARGDVRDSLASAILGEVSDTLAGRVRRFPGRTSDAAALINAAILIGDTTLLTRGVDSYFHLGGHEKSIASGDWPAVALSLAGDRMYEAAALVGRMHRAEVQASGRLGDIMAYAGFLRKMRSDAVASYQRVLMGRSSRGDLERAFIANGRVLWQAMRRNAEPVPYVPASLRSEMRNRFGTVITVEPSNGFSELFLAHVIDSSAIDADGQPAIMFVLDGEIADGLDGWLLDGAGGRAGWVARDTVFMRRTAFTETPFRAWMSLADPPSMPGELFRIMRDSTGDLDRARQDSLGYFPGVAARLFRDGSTSLLDSLRRGEAMDEQGRETAFTEAVFENLKRTSILLHETRHLVDSRSGRDRAAADDEFRAKLDEVAGAAHPKLALTAILSPNIGDASSHGQANRRVMRGLNHWMRMNGSSIPGYDPRVAALLQLPLLTDGQLRAAFESMRQ